MKYLKICLALMLAMCMAIGSLPVMAATSTATKEVASHTELASSLVALGILDSAISETATVTREELAVAVANILDIAYYKSMCADVAEDNANFSKINALVNLGVMLNDENGKFNPAATVTYKDVANAFARALCLEVLHEGRKTDTFIASIENELIVGVKYQDSATGAKFVKMIYDALALGTITFDGINKDGFLIDFKTAEPLLYKYRKIYAVEGVVEANEISSLDSTETAGAGRIAIDGDVYQAGDTDIANALGYSVVAYVDENANHKVISYYKNKNNILTISGKDISSTANYEISYRNENGKKKTVTLNRYIYTLYNGVEGGTPTADFLNVPDGKVILIDNNRDGKYDVVSVLDYKDYLVNSIDTKNKIIYDELGKAPLSYDPADNEVTISITGRPVSIEEFESYVDPGDVLTIAASNNVGGTNSVVIEVSFDKIEGVFYNYSDSNRTMTVSEFKYDVTAAFKNANLADGFERRTNVRIYLNAFEQVCYMEAIEMDTTKDTYGYLLRAANVGTLSTTLQVEIFKLDNTKEIFESGATLKVNGVKMTASEAYAAILATSYLVDPDGDNTYASCYDQVIVYALDDEGKLESIRLAYKDEEGKFAPNDFAFSKDVVLERPQCQNYNNTIWIVTGASNCKVSDDFISYYLDSATSGLEFAAPAGSKTLYLNKREADGTIPDKNIVWRGHMVDDAYYGNVTLYDIDDLGQASVALVEDTAAIKVEWHASNYATYRVVSDLCIASDDDGDYVALSVVESGKVVEYKIRDEITFTQCAKPRSAYSGSGDWHGSFYDHTIEGISDIFSVLAVGDVIQLAAKNGEVAAFRKVFTYSGRRDLDGYGQYSDDPDAEFHGDYVTIYAGEGFNETILWEDNYTHSNTSGINIYGRVVAKSGNLFKVKTKYLGVDVFRIRTNSSVQTKYAIIDISGDEPVVSVAAYVDIVAGEMAGDEVVVHSRGGYAQDVIIIKK